MSLYQVILSYDTVGEVEIDHCFAVVYVRYTLGTVVLAFVGDVYY